MTRQTRKRILFAAIGVVILVAVIYGFLPEKVPVEVAAVERGPLQVTIEEEGETDVPQRYVISSPMAAYARRIELKEGDRVSQGQPLVFLEPPRPALLDPRMRAEAQGRVEAAQARLAQMLEQVKGTRASAEHTEEEYARIERLHDAGSATNQALERVRTEAAQARANLEAAQAAVEAARGEVAAARAALLHDGPEHVQESLKSPVSGRVLIVHRRSAGMVSPGEPLLEVGDTDHLEVRVDVLSQDAVHIESGTRVLLDQWGGDSLLEASVKRVEPQGVTHISSLGVEEKRVTVVADLISPPASGLGAGFRVLARFIVWEGENVLLVPTSALFRTGNGWAAFVDDDGVAALRNVAIGEQTGLTAQVLSGLEEGELVIVHPGNAVEEGARVEPVRR